MARCNDCVQKCCEPSLGKPELTVPESCVVAPGVYENVIVEIDSHCRVVRMEEAPRVHAHGCDLCSGIATGTGGTDGGDFSPGG